MHQHPDQHTYDLTRSAALRSSSATHGPSSRTGTMDGAVDNLSGSAIAQLTKALERTSNQVKLPKFDGKPTSWIDFRNDFVEYYTSKGWQATVDHTDGPGHPTRPSPNFNFEHNQLLYQKLDAATRKGSANVQILKAAKGDGWTAWKHLLSRYDGFTERDIDTTLKALESLKHQHCTKLAPYLA